jgi:hypothetical protein
MVRSRVEQGKKMDVHEYNKQQKAKQQTESDYLNFINVPLPKELAYKILNGEKLAEKELLDSLKPKPKSDYEQAQDYLIRSTMHISLIDNKLADHEHEPLDLREKLDKFERIQPSPQVQHPEPQETLSQKLERLKQKQAEQPKPTAEPKQQDNDNDYSPF